ncbi:nitroreductase family protein [Nocardioides sp. Kera G14]|uniref:nitroreductase family protein n=1 Tax=Nocardioides sp. Kera G14 TaxID=2884264 RepID=UPI001D0FEB77|nr:nitroreductase family protein [Nocardioides sp. Kera G14]UDY23212.1 nitroreductase family protein [Nocardioides sp. Kera G14]
MDFQDVVRRRRMVRRYTASPVAETSLTRILDNAVRAPSAGFSQGWSFLVLSTPEDVSRYWEIFRGDAEWEADGWLRGMMTAPVLVIPCSSKAAYLSRYAEPDKGWTDLSDDAVREKWPMPFWHMDTAMAVQNMLLTVVDEGLGACYFGIPPRHLGEVREAFGIPDEWDPIGVVSIGHPDTGGAQGSPRRRTRKAVAEVVHRGRW